MLRRDLLRAFGAGATASLLPRRPHAQTTARPNIVVLLSDDQRWDTLGFEGDPLALTPQIDALAATGTAFRNSFVTTPICATSRASIFTSLYYSAHGFNFGTGDLDAALLPLTYPAQLRAAGYRTGFFGKFGVWFEEGLLEEVRDVMRRYGLPGAGRKHADLFDVYRNISHRPYVSPDIDGTPRHSLDKIAREAVTFIGAQDPGRPFCLSLSFNAPHVLGTAFPPAPSEAGLLEGRVVPPPAIETPAALPRVMKGPYMRTLHDALWATPEARQNVLGYYRMVAGIDRVVGEVRAALMQAGLAGNTVLIYASDNGLAMGERGLAGKWTHYEESIRVPLIVHAPREPGGGGTRPGAMALNVDLAPTILDFAGLPAPALYQGRSLRPLINAGAADGWRDDFLCEHEAEIDRGLPDWIGLRGTRFKFAEYIDGADRHPILHDLQEDPFETVNLAGEPAHAERVAGMRARAFALRERYARAL